MNIKQYFALAALILPTGMAAQNIDFETQSGYTSVGVYDTWEKSPFRLGTLKGNAKVVDNPYADTDEASTSGNSSAKVLAYQRSRFGSNTFGARIDLSSPLALTPTTKYVHVKIHKPKEGRTMLIGLGSRSDRPWQSKEVVQFNEISTRTINTDVWEDAVFAVSGAVGVNVYSFVVVTDLESTHDLTEDHVAYIDDIIVNDSPTPTMSNERYPISVDKTSTLSRTDRYTSSVSLTAASYGSTQTLSTNQQTDKLLFQDLTSSQLQAKAGESVTPAIGYNGSRMHGYVYLDRGTDGQFSYGINSDGTPADGSDLMVYSYYNGKNSSGSTVSNNCGASLSAFTVPAELKNGFYRMRFKIDWDYIDPAGNTAANNNSIVDNGGVIVDTRLNVHGDQVTLSRGQNSEGTNGEILDADGQQLDNKQIPFGKAYTITAKPANGFKLSKVVIRHGYNLDGNRLVMDTPQYEEVTVAAYLFTDNQYTIPAEYVDGDVVVTPYFSSDQGSSETTEDYPRNFTDDLAVTRTDRHLDSFSLTGTVSTTAQTVTVPSLTTNYVYRNLTESAEVGAVPGETLTFALKYTGWAMHPYLYIDYNADGQFDAEIGSNGIPTASSELATYSYYNGYNSLGESISAPGATELLASMPSFTLPKLPVGVYRARLKIDWDNIDPAGQWSEGGSNQINDNGGQIVDFLLNVHNEKSKLDIQTVNGSVVGASNTGQPDAISYKTALTLLPVAAADGYEATAMTIRHGQNLDGDRYDKHGNRQWSEYSVSADAAYSMPADSVNGEVRVTASFVDNGATLKLAFDEEFDGEDGSQPNSDHWTRCGWNSPTWKRFTAQTEAGQAQTGYIEDGKLVLRCLANTFADEVDGNGNKMEMISGAVESSKKLEFTYGKVEGRLKTLGHSGNFPAFWMMPADGSAGWPYCGEIDIWEQIDNSATTYHTIHSKWANGTGDGSECKGQGNNPAKSGSTTATLGQYHTFGFEWTETLLKWFVDGKQVFSYAKATSQDALDNGQWPFDKPFYLILNQSVGNGSWAANRDLSFTYETVFDWVRVYQKDGGDILTGISSVRGSSLDFYMLPGKVRIVAEQEQPVCIYNLQGCRVYAAQVQGNVDVPLPSGVYIINGTKALVP